MPYPNEHACRLREPGDFQPDSFRRIQREHEGKRYSVIMGRLKGETTMTEQAYRYSKDTWSASQARSHCKSHDGTFEAATGEAMLRTKLIRPEIRVLEPEKGRVQAIVSTEEQDRDGDILRASGWRLDHFLKHPVLLSSHDYMRLRSQIGEWEDMQVERKKLVGVARYYIGEGNEEADWGFNLAQKGRAAFSVGFLPDMNEAKEIKDVKGFFTNYEFNGQELLEVSQVTIPSNPQALQRMISIGVHPVIQEILNDMEIPEATPTDEILERLNALEIALKELIPAHTGLKAGPSAEGWPMTINETMYEEVLRHGPCSDKP